MLRRAASQVSLRSRERKLRLFLDLLTPGPETTVVDVGVTDAPFGGGSSDNFFEAMYPWPEQITAVSDVPLPRFAELFPTVRCVQADGRDLPFEDGAFDIAFSNAVLEHVGRQDDQRRFVHELCRVARRVFISTPNRWFPVDSHTLLPVVHWLPRGARDATFRALGQGRWTHVNLLSRRQLVELFPRTMRVKVIESRITVTAAASRD